MCVMQIEHQEEGTYDIRSRINIKGIAVNKKSVAFWNGKQAEVRQDGWQHRLVDHEQRSG